jgi:hypothetical protein
VLKWRVGLPDAKMEVSGAGSVLAHQGLEGKIHHDQKGKFGLRHATHYNRMCNAELPVPIPVINSVNNRTIPKYLELSAVFKSST